MGSTSSSQVANSIAQNISNSTMSTVQSNTNSSQAINNIKAVCSGALAGKLVDECGTCAKQALNLCSDQIKTIGKICSPEQMAGLNTLCSTVCTSKCNINNINLSNKVVMITTSSMNSTSKAEIKQNIQEKLKQSIKDASANQTINSGIDNITDAVMTSLQSIANNSSSTINLDFNNVSVSGITSDSFVNQLSDSLLKTDNSSSVINKAAVQISQSAEGTYKWIMIVGGILIMLLIFVFLILMLAKSRDLKDFLNKMLPVFIWLFLSLFTTLILIFVKPKIVTSVNTETKKEELNVASLLLWLTVFYIGYGLILYVIWKVKSKMGGVKNDSFETARISDDNEDDKEDDTDL